MMATEDWLKCLQDQWQFETTDHIGKGFGLHLSALFQLVHVHTELDLLFHLK